MGALDDGYSLSEDSIKQLRDDHNLLSSMVRSAGGRRTVLYPPQTQGGGGHSRVRFTILSTAFSEVLGAIGCDFVNARVNHISCKSTGVSVGDEIRIFDPELCHWNLPIELLVGLCGTATSMDAAEFIASRYYMPDCLYALDGQSCIWMVDTLCCAEEEQVAT